MAKTVTRKAVARMAYGKAIDPLPFVYTFEELQKGEEVPAREIPDADGIRSFANTRRAANARATAQNEAFSSHVPPIVKPDLKDPDFALATMVKALCEQGWDEAEATVAASELLGKK